jgi:hypothetical protein
LGHLGLCSQLRENTSLSPAEAVFGTPLVLSHEFLEVEEFSIDKISQRFSKILMPLFFLCLASTTRAASCQKSFLGTSSAPPLSKLCQGLTPYCTEEIPACGVTVIP